MEKVLNSTLIAFWFNFEKKIIHLFIENSIFGKFFEIKKKFNVINFLRGRFSWEILEVKTGEKFFASNFSLRELVELGE